ncbi:MAG TPA: NAD-dependent epimerase/dehydratase family protein, partial [Deltaproteobacteria bacterium]|nr:NAD-dependent epimerase/dehydratase family protein [Deltaproteobacteria bacterium]
MSSFKILVTGGAGFVGSHLALALKEKFSSSKVIALDNLKRRGSELNLSRLSQGGVEFLHGDVRNPGDLGFMELDWIIECSAEPSALAGRFGDTDYLVHTNLLGTYHSLEL